ncbi:Uncharacterised protein [Klebsiella michiganensis]|uniref:Uncharacterized protein n=1 Tax=Klebsiella michiganensis TaxID=1134687 RepID=A0A7H4LWL3_9ENTR|nr:Uncharacterised protein [Klebsiella michiganensis]
MITLWGRNNSTNVKKCAGCWKNSTSRISKFWQAWSSV